MKKIISMFLITFFLNPAFAGYVLSTQKYNEVTVIMVCLEGRVYAELGDALIKTVWEKNGEVEHLKCEDYKTWENM